MVEKLRTREEKMVPRISDKALWLDQAVSKIKTDNNLTDGENNVAMQILFGNILTELKDIETGASSLKNESKEDSESQLSKVAKLQMLARQIAGNRVDGFKRLASSNKFRPIEPIDITPAEINQERILWADRTEISEPTDIQIKDFVVNKKIISVLLSRLLEGDGKQKVANINELDAKRPELAADLGKIFQALEIIELHAKNLEKISEREIEKRAKVVGYLNGYLNPALN